LKRCHGCQVERFHENDCTSNFESGLIKNINEAENWLQVTWWELGMKLEELL